MQRSEKKNECLRPKLPINADDDESFSDDSCDDGTDLFIDEDLRRTSRKKLAARTLDCEGDDDGTNSPAGSLLDAAEELLVKAALVNIVVLSRSVVLGEFLSAPRKVGAWCRTVRVGMTPEIQKWSEVCRSGRICGRPGRGEGRICGDPSREGVDVRSCRPELIVLRGELQTRLVVVPNSSFPGIQIRAKISGSDVAAFVLVLPPSFR